MAALGGNLFDGASEPTQQTGRKLKYYPEEDYYDGGTPFKITVTRKNKKKRPYWVSPKGAGNMTVMPGDPEMIFFAPIAAGAGIAASPAIASTLSSAISGIKTAGDAVAATAAGQRLTSGLNFISKAVGNSKAWPWTDAGLTSVFGAHGIDKVIRGDIHNVGDVVDTGLDLLPLSQLAKPVVSTASRVAANAELYRATRKPMIPEGFESTSTLTFGDLGDKAGYYIHVGTPKNKVWISKDKTWPELSELGENSKGVPLYQIDSKAYDARFGEPALVDYEGNSLGIPISKGSWEEPNSIFRGFP